MSQYYDPKSYAPILQQGATEQAKYNSQITGAAGGLPALGQLAQNGAQVAIDQNKKQMSLELAKRDYANYLALSPGDQNLPDNIAHARIAAQTLGMAAPQTKENLVSPDIMSKWQKELGLPKPLEGTKENEAAAMAQSKQFGEARLAREKAATDAKMTAGAAKQSKNDEAFWAKQLNEFAPTNAKRGTLLGVAALGNSKADRALTEINANPTSISPQLKSMIQGDLAGIMAGGQAHVDQIAAAGYPTIAEDWARLKQKFTGTVQQAEVPTIIAELKKIIQTIKQVDSKIINENTDIFEATNSEAIARNPQKWKNIKAIITRGMLAPGESAPAPIIPGQPAKSGNSLTDAINAL